jgi:hypothetical protein
MILTPLITNQTDFAGSGTFKIPKFLYLVLLTFFLLGCSGKDPGATVKNYAKTLDIYPDFSIMLEDMKEDGSFLPSYWHKYKLIYGDATAEDLRQETTDWVQVSKREFRQHAKDLGMCVTSRTSGGELETVPKPAGYQYVGNEKYGKWRDNGSGGSFWEFYGKWMFMSTMFDMAMGPRIMRRDYGMYRNSYYGKRRAWYGSGGQYGTNGSVTRSRKPAYFKRTASKSKFKNSVASRMGRSKSSARSRSGGYGK